MTNTEGPPKTPRTECRTSFASLLSLSSLSKTGRAEFAALLSRWERPGEGACMSAKLEHFSAEALAKVATINWSAVAWAKAEANLPARRSAQRVGGRGLGYGG